MNTMTISRLGIMASLLVASTVSHAKEIIKLAEDRQVKTQAETEFQSDLKEIPKGKQVQLCLDGRIEWDSLGGNSHAVDIKVNGQGLVGKHLINKPLAFTMRNGDELYWATEDGTGYRMVYAPDFSNATSTDEEYVYGLPETDPFHFVWDIKVKEVRQGGAVLTEVRMPGDHLAILIRKQ